MPAEQCRVSFIDSDALSHVVQVRAEYLYEAVALALRELRADPLAPPIQPTTEVVVAVERPQVEHRIRLSDVQKWAQPTTRGGPAAVLKKQRLKALLDSSMPTTPGGQADRQP
jgi:hypothetical protein